MSDECRGRERDLRVRTKGLALRVIALSEALGRDGAAGTIGRQLLRCGTSVGAQYREALRARSAAEFISKIESAAQELEETMYWFELLVEASLLPDSRLAPLVQEADEIMAMLVSSVRTAKAGRRPLPPRTAR